VRSSIFNIGTSSGGPIRKNPPAVRSGSRIGQVSNSQDLTPGMTPTYGLFSEDRQSQLYTIKVLRMTVVCSIELNPEPYSVTTL